MASSRFGMGFSFYDAPSPGRQSLAPVRLTKSYPLVSVGLPGGLRSAGVFEARQERGGG
jgi:hypothetical protein